jgi:hypothetical protein
MGRPCWREGYDRRTPAIPWVGNVFCQIPPNWWNSDMPCGFAEVWHWRDPSAVPVTPLPFITFRHGKCDICMINCIRVVVVLQAKIETVQDYQRRQAHSRVHPAHLDAVEVSPAFWDPCGSIHLAENFSKRWKTVPPLSLRRQAPALYSHDPGRISQELPSKAKNNPCLPVSGLYPHAPPMVESYREYSYSRITVLVGVVHQSVRLSDRFEFTGTIPEKHSNSRDHVVRLTRELLVRAGSNTSGVSVVNTLRAGGSCREGVF